MWRTVVITALVFGAIGLAYYVVNNADVSSTVLYELVCCLPAGGVFGAILYSLGVGRSSSTAKDARKDRTNQKLEQQRYQERGRD